MNLSQPQWKSIDDPATSVVNEQAPEDAFASALDEQPKPGKTISDYVGGLSLPELLAFARGCVIGHRQGLDIAVIRTAACLVSESENIDSTEMCRSLAGRVATALLTSVVEEHAAERRDYDSVPF